MMKSRRGGFTLIELMIVVAIVAILTAIAYPSYQGQLRKARRASAESHLMDIAQRQQQYLLDARSYAPDLAALKVTTPTDVSDFYQAPVIDLTTPAPPPPGFTVTITPKAGTPQAIDGALTINSVGARTTTGTWSTTGTW